MADCDMNGQSQDESTDEKLETSENPVTAVEDDDDEDDRKIFIGGLHFHTKEDRLRKYCEDFGEVLKCDLKTNSTTGGSRCFAFVVFKDVDSVKKFLEKEKHELDSKIIDPKLANRQEEACKVFVGGLSTNATEEDVRTYFSSYGTIVEITLPVDESTKNRRSFAFVVFAKKSTVKAVTQTRYHTINGKECEVKKSTPKPSNRGWGFRGGRGPIYSRGGYQMYPGYGYDYYGGGGGYSPYGYGGYGGYAGYGGYGGYGGYDQYNAYSGYDQQSQNTSKSRGRGGRGYSSRTY